MQKEMAYKFRFYPTAEQEEILAQTFGVVRFVYNRMLRERMDAWYDRKERVGYKETSAAFTQLRNSDDYPWLRDVSYVPVQQGLRHLQTAYDNFFAKRTNYPKFKKRRGKQAAEYTKSAFRVKQGRVYLAKMKEPLDIVIHRNIDLEQVTTVTVTKSPSGRYHISMRFTAEVEPHPESDTSVGVDLGLTSFVTLSTGEKINSPKSKHHAKLAKAQRRLARKQPGSRRYEKQKAKVARIHEKISDSRKDFLHKLSHRLVSENQTIAVESLAVVRMLQNRALARGISDASWSEFTRQLRYKSEWYGRTLVEIDQWYPSTKRCNCCGHVLSFLPLSKRNWTCPECGENHDRDVNAAKNILAAGQAVTARGGSVRPRRSKNADAVAVEARTTPELPGSPVL